MAGEPADGGTARAGLTLVAGLGGVIEIRAAGALKQVAGRGRPIAELARGTGKDRPREHAVVAPHPLVGGEVGVAHQRPDPQSALRRGLDRVEPEPVHVDQVGGRLNLELHQVKQVGAARNELRIGVGAAAAAAWTGDAARS